MLIGLLTFLLAVTGLLLIVLIIGLQQGSEGGIGSAFGGGNSAGFFGASGGVSLIVKSTWVCVVLFIGLSMGLAWLRTHEKFGVSRELNNALLEETTPTVASPTPAPSTPVLTAPDAAVPTIAPAP